MSAPSTLAEPVLLPLGRGAQPHRHCWLHQPTNQPAGQTPQRLVVHVHGFAEELNKSRRMTAEMARLLAQQGCTVLRVDLLGCGDCPGDAGDATWQDWVQDVRCAAEWLMRDWRARWQGAEAPQCWLWGLRSGALVANEAAGQLEGAWHRLLWQPATNGAQVLQQFLRLEAAAGFLGKAASPKGPSAKARLTAGETVEIAGYALSPSLAAGLETARLRPPASPVQLVWLDVDTQAPVGPSPAAKLVLDAWQAAGCHVAWRSVAGPMFWQTTETTHAPDLLATSVRAVLNADSVPSALAT